MTGYVIVLILMATLYIFTIVTALACLFLVYMALFGDIVERNRLINIQRRKWQEEG